MMYSKFKIYSTFFVILTFPVNITVHCASSEEWGDDFFASASEEQSKSPSAPKSLPIKKEKRWNRQGVCDHDAITSVMLKLILDAQDKMINGDNSTGLLPLDPIHIPKIIIDPDEISNGTMLTDSPVRANFEDFYIKGLSNFTVSDIKMDLEKMLLNISIEFESISVSGSGRLQVGPLKLPVFGKGNFLFKPEGVQTFVYAWFGSHENGTRYLEDFDFGLNLKTLDIQFTSPLRPVRGWQPFKGAINKFGATLFNKIEQKLHPKLRSRGFEEISKRMGTWKKLNEEILEDMINHTVFCYIG